MSDVLAHRSTNGTSCKRVVGLTRLGADIHSKHKQAETQQERA